MSVKREVDSAPYGGALDTDKLGPIRCQNSSKIKFIGLRSVYREIHDEAFPCESVLFVR